MSFEEFIAHELYELRHWSNDETLTFEPSYYNRLRRAYNAGQQESLRDRFASSALNGMLSDSSSFYDFEGAAQDAYRYADAILKERSK